MAITTGFTVVVFAVLYGSGFTTKMSLEVLEFSQLETIKDSTKNVWTNLAVTAALFLTVIFAMLQIDPIAAQYPQSSDDEDNLVHLQQAYVCIMSVALFFCMGCLFECVINLTFVEPLRNEDCIKYFIANTNTIGSPIMYLMLACIYTMIATGIWVWGTYGDGPGIQMVIVIVVFLINIGIVFIDRLLFDPSGQTKKSEEWQFTMLPVEKWPARVTSRNEKSVKIFNRLGKAAKVHEATGAWTDGTPEAAERS